MRTFTWHLKHPALRPEPISSLMEDFVDVIAPSSSLPRKIFKWICECIADLDTYETTHIEKCR